MTTALGSVAISFHMQPNAINPNKIRIMVTFSTTGVLPGVHSSFFRSLNRLRRRLNPGVSAFGVVKSDPTNGGIVA